MIERNRDTTGNKESVLAVVGGGRWGRVIMSVLADMSLPFDRILVVSSANKQAVARLIQDQQSRARLPLNIVPSLDELLTRYNVTAAIVVNSADQHFETSTRLIEHGINVLLEKPVALSLEDARTLLSKASTSSVCLVPGLQYRFCSYIHSFAEQVSLLGKTPHSFLIEWSDQAGEIRYGETKTYDSSINVAQDVMPHIWTILSIIFGNAQLSVDSCQKSTHDGCYGDFSATVKGGPHGRITLERNATQRRRMISVQFDSGTSLSIDFTKEPGFISLNTKTISADPEWEKKPKPLARQLDYFLSAVSSGGLTTEADIRACLDSVAFSEHSSALLRAQH